MEEFEAEGAVKAPEGVSQREEHPEDEGVDVAAVMPLGAAAALKSDGPGGLGALRATPASPAGRQSVARWL